MQDLIIKDVNDETISAIKKQADLNGKTVEETAKDWLCNNVYENKRNLPVEEKKKKLENWKKRLKEIREKIGPVQSDSSDHIREMRDSR